LDISICALAFSQKREKETLLFSFQRA
jgi:hypothetical protein